MPDDRDDIGTEGLHKLASEESKITSLVIGFNTCEGTNWTWLVTHPMSLDFEQEEDRGKVLEAIEDLQKDTAFIITDLSTGRPLPFGYADVGEESSWCELPVSFGEI
jgi:hypothetical protein